MTPDQFAQLLRAVSADSIWKIVLGAALALIGGFLAKIWDEWRSVRNRRRVVFIFIVDVLDSYTTTFAELVELQGQTGTIWIDAIDRMLEEYQPFSRNREHLVLVRDTALRRDIQSTIQKVQGTAGALKAAVMDETSKRASNAAQTDIDAAARMTRHRFDQLRDRVDQARTLRQRLSGRH